MRYISIEDELIQRVIGSLNNHGENELANELQDRLTESETDQISGSKID